MLRLLAQGYFLVVQRVDQDEGARWITCMYTRAGEQKWSRAGVVEKLSKACLIEKVRGMGGDTQMFGLTETGKERAARLLRRKQADNDR